jgi:pimeloyl-ACP methyl ester carboxylesterase
MNLDVIGRGADLQVGTARVHVRRWGPIDGRPLLFLHSLGPAASGALLGPGLGPLPDAGYSIAAPDQPGFGLTPPLEPDGYTPARLVELAWSIADALGWDRLVLAGHSWGGSIAIHAAAARPERVRALVLVDSGHLDYADSPGANLGQTLDEMSAAMEAARRRAPDRAGVARDLELPVDDPVVEAFMEGVTDDGAGGLISRTLGSSRAGAMYHLARARQSDQWAAIAAAGIPTLLLLATEPDDLRATNEAAAGRFHAGVPQADVRPIPGATHSLITDLRGEFGQIVLDWLARVG